MIIQLRKKERKNTFHDLDYMQHVTNPLITRFAKKVTLATRNREEEIIDGPDRKLGKHF